MTKSREFIYFLAGIALNVVIVILLCSYTEEQDALHKRVFNTSLSETKNGVVAKKTIADQLLFKNGRLKSEFLYNKFGYKWLRYHITKDSVYTDSTNTEVRLLLVEATATDEKNQTVYVNFSTCEWDLDGTIRITKNDKLKRYYDLVGREKGGKPKKEKSRKKETPVFEVLK